MATHQIFCLSSKEVLDRGTVQKSKYSRLLVAFPPFLLRKVLSEFISTFLFVFVTCGVVALYRNDEKRVSRLGASVATGLVVTVMIYSVGHISGAHMNPAVTFAYAVSKHSQFPWIQVPFYWLSQLSGATFATFVLKALLNPMTDFGTTTPAGTALQALIMEIVVTFCTMFVASAVATDSRAVGELAGLAVGSSVCINSILAGPISGGSMNPARSLGAALASNRYESLWVYFLGPIIGALLGSWSYNFIRFDPLEKSEPSKISSFKLGQSESQQASDVVVSAIV